MAEVLEIQIKDSGNVGSRGSASPRAPSTGSVGPAWPRSAPPAASGASSAAGPASSAGTQAGVVEQVLENFGYGRQLQAFRQLYDSIAAPKASALNPAPQGRNAANADTAGGAIERGFARVEELLSPLAQYFSDLPGPMSLTDAREQAAAAPVAPPAGTSAHAPASTSLRHNPDLDEAFGAPHAPATSVPRIPSAAEHPPEPPLAVPAKGAAAQESTVINAAEATEAGEAEMAAGAVAAGGSLASLAEVALPVAAAFVIMEAAIKLTEATLGEVREVTMFFGQQIKDIAGNDYLGAFQSRLDFTEKSLAKLPIIGGVLSSAFGAAVAPVRAFTVATQAFTQRAHELSRLSAPIAVAEAQADIRSLFADMREANALGPDLARMLDAESKMQTELRAMFLPIKRFLTGILASALETIVDWLRSARIISAGEFWEKLAQTLGEVIVAGITLNKDGIAQAIERLKKAVDGIARKLDDNNTPPEETYMADLLNPNNNWAALKGDEPPFDPRPNIPIVQAFPGT